VVVENVECQSDGFVQALGFDLDGVGVLERDDAVLDAHGDQCSMFAVCSLVKGASG